MKKLLGVAVLACALGLAAASSASAAIDSGTVLVKFRDGVSTTEGLSLTRATGALEQVGAVRRLGVAVVRVDGNPAAVAARLNKSSAVLYAEPNEILRATAVPNDPRFGELYGLNNTGQSGGTADADIDAPEGWDAATLGGFPSTGGPKVGLIDTGILSTHEDLVGKVAGCAKSQGVLPVLSGSIQVGSCADDNGHGSHTAGTITANANNGKGVAGVAFNSPLIVCKALGGPLGSGSTADVANCITWVKDQGAKVISMSLGGGDSTTLHNAVNYAWSGGGAGGAVVVAAAGNDGDSTVNYPAGYAEAVSVAATDRNDARASFSNANADVEIAAPGVDTLSTYNDGGYRLLSGTSMATPHVAGVAAIIWGKNAGATAATIRSKLDAAVDDKGAAGRDPVFGFGRVNLQKAATG
jgi:thermitase